MPYFSSSSFSFSIFSNIFFFPFFWLRNYLQKYPYNWMVNKNKFEIMFYLPVEKQQFNKTISISSCICLVFGIVRLEIWPTKSEKFIRFENVCEQNILNRINFEAWRPQWRGIFAKNIYWRQIFCHVLRIKRVDPKN